MSRLFSILFCAVAACSSPSVELDAASADCPSAPPEAGRRCESRGLSCLYDRCASVGLVVASCEADDAGDASWRIATEACSDSCNGNACVEDQICVARAGGAYLVGCAAHSCGDGPLTCDCVCGEGASCTQQRGEVVVECRVDCGLEICP